MAYNKETEMYEGYIYKIYNDVNDKVYIGQTTATLKERWHGHMSSALNEKRYKSAMYNAMRKYGRDKFHMVEIDIIIEPTLEKLVSSLNELEELRIVEYSSLTTQNGYNLEKGGSNKIIPGRRVCKYDLELNLLETYISLQEAGRQNNIDGATIWAVCRHDFYTAGGFVWAYEGETPVKPDYDKKLHPLNYRPSKKKPYVSQAMPEDVKRQRKLNYMGWNGERIFQYNSFGELINIYTDLIEASEILQTSVTEIKKSLNGENLHFGKTVLRYENDSFDKFPRSKQLQPITIYDMYGVVVTHVETIIDAEKFVGCSSGDVLKAIKRGGSYKGYMFSYYGDPLIRKVYRSNRPLEMCDDNMNVIKRFETKKEIYTYFNTSDEHKQLNKAIETNQKYRDYYWRYEEEFELTT